MPVIALLITISLSFQAHGFTLNNNVGAAFSEDEVRINVADFPCNQSNLDPEEILDLAVRAVDQFWNRVPTSRLRLRRGSVQTKASAFEDGDICDTSNGSCSPNEDLIVDRNILITCNSSQQNFPSNSGILAISVPNNIENREIRGAIVALNNRPDTRLKNQSPAELKAILAHEIGHAFGLGHSPVKDSLMYFTLVPTRERLGWDDIDGVTYLYPKSQPVSCGTWQQVQSSGNGPILIAVILGLGLVINFLGSRLPFGDKSLGNRSTILARLRRAYRD